MSRSRRKQPFSSVTLATSAKRDKQTAHRSVRRTQNRYLSVHTDQDTFLLPLEFDCSHNDVWGWDIDGPKKYRDPAKYGHEQWFIEMLRK